MGYIVLIFSSNANASYNLQIIPQTYEPGKGLELVNFTLELVDISGTQIEGLIT